MSTPVRMVNTVPNIRIKKEVTVDDDDDVVSCRVCSKGFTNEVALKNHVRMEHIKVFSNGDPSTWLQKIDKPVKYKVYPSEKAEDKNLIKVKTDKLISSMSPGNLMSLASKDVSYIIIKAEDLPKMKKKKEKIEPQVVKEKKDKEPQPITGPFECLQPSTLVADGTCHQIFFSCCEYSAHYRDEHTRRRKGHRCQVCEKPLLNPGDEALPYCCDVCGVGFSTAGELGEHTTTVHVKLKPFACSVCNKRFTQQGGVQQHMRMHTGDRPFNCTFCPKAFTQKSGLDQHIRIHTKVKPYRCVICSKSFCQSIHLKQHMRTHTNVSPFMCGICQKRFKQSSHLNYHLKNHNPATLTEEQKLKYSELIGMINKEIEIEIDTNEVAVDQVTAEQEQGSEHVDEQVQIVYAEEGEEYILSDQNESWNVELVQS